MTEISLDNLSVSELQNLQNGIAGAIEQKRHSELLALRSQVDTLIDESPFTLEEVLAAQKMRKPIAPKYRNPEDETQTWTGRGRKPRWVAAFLDAGNELEALTI